MTTTEYNDTLPGLGRLRIMRANLETNIARLIAEFETSGPMVESITIERYDVSRAGDARSKSLLGRVIVDIRI